MSACVHRWWKCWGWLRSQGTGLPKTRQGPRWVKEHTNSICVCVLYKQKMTGRRAQAGFSRQPGKKKKKFHNAEPCKLCNFLTGLPWCTADVVTSELSALKAQNDRGRVSDCALWAPKHPQPVAATHTIKPFLAIVWMKGNPLQLSAESHTDVSFSYEVGQVKICQ